MTTVQCYVPTETFDITVKDAFYEQMHATRERLRKDDIVIVMGNLNGKVGSNNTLSGHMTGKL